MKRFFKKGDYIQDSKEKYSDYCVGNLYIVTKDFDLKQEVGKVKESLTPEKRICHYEDGTGTFGREYYAYRLEEVWEILLKNLPLEKLNHTELWLGEYGEFMEWDYEWKDIEALNSEMEGREVELLDHEGGITEVVIKTVYEESYDDCYCYLGYYDEYSDPHDVLNYDKWRIK